jgi:glycerophosphoryl diester phosphodiesterase
MRCGHREGVLSVQHEPSLLTSAQRDYRLAWRELALTDIVCEAVAFVLFAPLVSMMFHVLLAVYGTSVLADHDILWFFLRPIGWIALVLLGAGNIAIIAIEQAALMTIALAASQGRRVSVWSALVFAAHRAWPVLYVTARMVVIGLLWAAPFLAAAGGVCLALLTEFDINFYLDQKPPAFWTAAAIIGALACVLLVVLVRLLAGWVFALPLLLFEGIAPSAALRTSRQRFARHDRTIVLWVVGWFLATSVVSAVAIGAVGIVGRLIVPLTTFSLPLLVATVGAMFLLWGLVNIVVTLVSATTFAVLLVNLYCRLANERNTKLSNAALLQLRGTDFKFPIRRRYVLAGTLAAVVAAAVVGVVSLESITLEDHTQITAHRGASADAPENTLAAVERAIADGADWVEIDVQESSDGVVLVVHDSDLQKLAGVPLRIWEATAEQLQAVDIGSSFAPEFAGEPVPTLAEVLAACKDRVGLNIELKYYGHDQDLEQRVVDLVEAAEMQSQIVVMSLQRNAIRKMQQLRPKWKVGLLTAVAVGDLTRLDADFLAISVTLASRKFVGKAHRHDKEVFVWTVNDPVTMSVMMSQGIDNIITDRPALARYVLEERADMNPVERLLVELAVLFGVSPQTSATADDV